MWTGNDIKTARKQLGESQAAFGQRFGVDQSTIHRWEQNGPPASVIVQRVVAEFLTSLPTEVA